MYVLLLKFKLMCLEDLIKYIETFVKDLFDLLKQQSKSNRDYFDNIRYIEIIIYLYMFAK